MSSKNLPDAEVKHTDTTVKSQLEEVESQIKRYKTLPVDGVAITKDDIQKAIEEDKKEARRVIKEGDTHEAIADIELKEETLGINRVTHDKNKAHEVILTLDKPEDKNAGTAFIALADHHIEVFPKFGYTDDDQILEISNKKLIHAMDSAVKEVLNGKLTQAEAIALQTAQHLLLDAAKNLENDKNYKPSHSQIKTIKNAFNAAKKEGEKGL